MVKCDLCGKKLGFFNTKNICDESVCDATVCSDCLAKSNQNDSKSVWGTCNACGRTYCGKHYENHYCDDSDEDSADDEVTTDIFEYESKNQLFVIVDYSDRSDNLEAYQEELAEIISKYLASGYVIQGYYSEVSEVWLVRKNG